jgi:Tol biopolymer transport system component
MSLTPGTRIGPYEVTSSLGAGGMGEVYRARDSRLDRQVAIKVLPAAVSADADRRARFEREAKAIAALSHPNILAIHDIGESAGTLGDAAGSQRAFLYAVTELLEGETLRDRLTTQGALPIRKAIDIAVQIARGLAAAHDRGIVHRDLKPENIFVLMDGQVKILDFGLARHATPASSGSGATLTAAVTDPGTVMGTIGYMAPEQVRGADVDARTDLFALGIVLYEMVAGQRAFQRETAAETMTAILREDPPELSTARADVSPALERIVRHCLEKNPAERFQTARDVAFALEAFSGTDIGSHSIVDEARPRRRWRGLAAVAATAIVAAAAGYLAKSRLQSPAPEIAFEYRTWDPQWISNARFAGDGQTIVYSGASSGNQTSLFIVRPGQSIAQPLGPPRTHLLAVSKNGELAVLTNATFLNHRLFTGTLARMPMDGGARPLMDNVREADWSPDGTSLAVVHDVGAKDRIEYPPGKVLYEAGGYLSDPRVAPDGRRIAFVEHPSRYDDRGWLKVVDLSGHVATLAGEFWGVEGMAWTHSGKTILFSAVTMDAPGLKPHAINADGTPHQRSAFPSIDSAITMDAAPDGRILYAAGDSRISIRVLTPGDSAERELPWLDVPIAADLSRDGRWLLFSDEGVSAGLNYAVGYRNTDGSPAVRLGEGSALGLSPDGKWAIGRIPSPPPARFVLYPTGAGQPVRLDVKPITTVKRVAWFPDGRLLICGAEATGIQRCYRASLGGSAATAVTPDGTTDGWPAPDGRTLLLQTDKGVWQLADVESGATRVVPGDHVNDTVLGWTQDSRVVFVVESSTIPARTARVDLSTGARTFVRELTPSDRTAVMAIYPGRVVDDGRAYVYTYWRQAQRAIVVKGIPID